VTKMPKKPKLKEPEVEDHGLTQEQYEFLLLGEKLFDDNRYEIDHWRQIDFGSLFMLFFLMPMFLFGFLAAAGTMMDASWSIDALGYIMFGGWGLGFAAIGFKILASIWNISTVGVSENKRRSEILNGVSIEELRKQYSQYEDAQTKYDKQRAHIKAAVKKEKEAKARAKLEAERKREKYWEQQDGKDFEKNVGALFKDQGYSVKFTPATGDGGVDIIIKQSSSPKIAVQCKRYKSRVTAGHVREFIGALKALKFEKGIFVTVKGVTAPAQKLATENKIEILTVTDLIAMSGG
jgi:HJR/Mrr/RecB family endonuclease